MNNRVISLNGEVNEQSALLTILNLLNLNSENKTEPIYLYINSEGGSIIHGLAIYDVINHIDAPVYTICCGLAASMGSFLLSCGQKGHRYALPHSRILIHQPLIFSNNGSLSTFSEINKIASRLTEMRNKLEEIMAENIGKPVNVIHKDCERDNWMTAEEALKYGLIDKIVKK